MGTFVHLDSNGLNGTSIPSITWGTAAAATQNLDLAIMPWVFLNTETPTDPTSEAWSLAVSNVSQDCEGRILYRVCDGTESGDITGWSTTGTGNRQAAVLCVLRGYQFISGFKIRNETVNSTSHDCPALLATDGFNGNFPADGDTILVFVFDRAASTGATPPTNWTVRTGGVFAATGTGGTIVGMADDNLTDSATIPADPGAWTGLASSDDAFTVTMSLRPASGGTSLTLGLPVEVNTAQSLDKAKSLPLGLTAESSIAQAVTRAKSLVLGLIEDHGVPFALAAAAKSKPMALAIEASTPQPLTLSKAGPLGLATESSQALALSPSKSGALALATESSVALPLSATKSKSLGLSVEVEMPLALELGTFTLELIIEHSTALGLVPTKSLELGLITESEVALGLTLRKDRELTLTSEIETALGLSANKSLTLGMVTEICTVLALETAPGGGLELVVYQNGVRIVVSSFGVWRNGVFVPRNVDDLDVT